MRLSFPCCRISCFISSTSNWIVVFLLRREFFGASWKLLDKTIFLLSKRRYKSCCCCRLGARPIGPWYSWQCDGRDRRSLRAEAKGCVNDVNVGGNRDGFDRWGRPASERANQAQLRCWPTSLARRRRRPRFVGFQSDRVGACRLVLTLDLYTTDVRMRIHLYV